MTNFNGVDYIISCIFIFSIFAGLARGLVKEVLSLLTWGAAFTIACMFSARLAASITGSDSVQSAMSVASSSIGMNASQPVSILSIGASFVAIFVGVLIAGKMVNYFISSAVEGRGISIANRFLGALFGLGRGFVIVLTMMFIVQLTPIASQPVWAQSLFVHSFQPAVQWVDDQVQPGIEGLKARVGQTLRNVDSQYLQGGGSNVFQGFSR